VVAVSGDIDRMGGVEYAVPIGVAVLLYFLFPAFLKNRQSRLVEKMRNEFHPNLIRAGEVRLAGRFFTFPAALALTADYLVVHNVLSIYRDEVPLERLRNLALQYKLTKQIPHPEDDSPSGNVLIISTTEQTYRILFNEEEEAPEWKESIERTI